MKQIILICCFLLSKQLLIADPGVGIVTDSKGNVFYTDLSNVWMIKPDGSKIIAVPNVHTHELYMNAKNELFGEHLWYDESLKTKWAHYLWRRNADGSITRLKDTTEGFSEWVSFVRDANGNQYYLEKSIPSNFWKIDSAGTKTLLASRSFAGLGRLHINEKGILFFSNKGDLYCIPPADSIELVAAAIGEPGLFEQPGGSSHTILSIWSDAKKNLYVATGNMIKKIDHRKLVTTIYKSARGWNPCGGVVAANGDFWVMEYNSKNEVRLNKISAEERKEIIKENAFKVYGMPLILISGILLLLYFLFRRKK
jgi:hypothetical protein